ncbi:putative BioA alternative protein [Candidatus Sumerlaea chitinivorans]|uniref:Putative BioA alternative protein n=1 Tax=Sumerlaea chitinivorans TaxID=2250252 RepID=A0A2Z4Y4J3_SUMC1|nr:putative BioA alternative protein [Candidatus Sumerlaea chitinivorans]
MREVKHVAVLGAGGLGRNMARLLGYKREFKLVAICDKGGYAFDEAGISADLISSLPAGTSVATLPKIGVPSSDAIGDLMAKRDAIDGIFVALPNLPNEAIPQTVERIAASGFRGVMVDALKRTRAVELMLALRDKLAAAQITYITGAGATPGLLTAAAALAAQSFVEIESVEIYFGVGIANWDAYRATIREDIAHLEGFSVEKVAQMTDEEIEQELEKRNGILELVNMEHADDVMLEVAGVVDRSKVKVGGIVDTRNPKKPVSTNVKITGITFEGKRSTHTFILGDETSMAANVNGPALGYMKTGFWLQEHGIYGLFTSAELMPRFPR